jgi:ribonucleoside-triphosphate reductase
MTSKYGTPYFANFINSDMKPEDARSMCCHLRIDQRELRKRGGGFFGANPLTGSTGVTTINVPRIGYFSKTEKEFFNRLLEKMNLAKKSLEIKRKILERFTENNLYPYAKYYLSSIKKRFGGYWRNHFSTIGLIGMNEACLNFLGKDITTQEGRDFSIKVLDFMREKLMDYQNETNNIYNLEATPGEGTTFRLAKTDKEKFPDIICANEEAFKNGAAPYYTNSTQLPVGYTDDIFEALDLQDELQTKYTGGTVFHGFIGEKLPDGESSKILVKKIAANYRLPYFTITPTFSICQQHGYISGEHETCPECGATTEVYSRVVGYIRPVSQWNKGKKSEFRDRKTFKL